MNYTNTFFESLVHLFYPHTCLGCGNDVLERTQVLCMECITQLPLTNFHLHTDNPVAKVFRGRLPLISATSFVYFTKDSMMQRLMHQFKYRGKKDIGIYFGKRMGECYRQAGNFNGIDGLVPLPLHPRKQKLRGYNQAEVICDGLSAALDIPVNADAVSRTKVTSTQTHRNRLERWENMEGRFVLNDGHGLEHKHIALVDDVITTGATLEACGTALLRAKGAGLSIISLAYTSL